MIFGARVKLISEENLRVGVVIGNHKSDPSGKLLQIAWPCDVVTYHWEHELTLAPVIEVSSDMP
jgi:hypothetical protein